MRQRYFLVGFNRCGTTAIAEMLEKNGIKAVHHVYTRNGEKRNIAKDIEKNIESGHRPLDGMDDIDAFTDVEFVSSTKIIQGNKFFPEIMNSYPNMKFILNVRNRDDWIKSRVAFPEYMKRHVEYYGKDATEIVKIWEDEWDDHIESITNNIPQNRLLIMNLEAPNREEMEKFFGMETVHSLRRRNQTITGPIAKVAQKVLPLWVVKVIPNGLKNYLKDF